MSFDNSLFTTDAGYYEYIPGRMWLPGKLVGRMTWSRRAVDDAINVELQDSDVILATYPKTGIVLNISYFGATGTPVLDFWWRLLCQCGIKII